MYRCSSISGTIRGHLQKPTMRRTRTTCECPLTCAESTLECPRESAGEQLEMGRLAPDAVVSGRPILPARVSRKRTLQELLKSF
jgi:hypothetical protein